MTHPVSNLRKIIRKVHPLLPYYIAAVVTAEIVLLIWRGGL